MAAASLAEGGGSYWTLDLVEKMEEVQFWSLRYVSSFICVLNRKNRVTYLTIVKLSIRAKVDKKSHVVAMEGISIDVNHVRRRQRPCHGGLGLVKGASTQGPPTDWPHQAPAYCRLPPRLEHVVSRVDE
uniref:Uncharacterized protein n=1 Tax=Oryza sativa subsp. japonica TaxID=39947 RepID=Q6EP92_ORYSJ|nr:hypothetical protein [Oryza sativa Japonica Group]